LPDATHAATSDDDAVRATNSNVSVVSGARRFRVGPVHARLAAGNGGYEVVHDSPGVEVGVYVLVAPEPDRQQPHEDDEIYIVLEGHGVLTVEGEKFELTEGDSIFVPAGALHQFTAYEHLSVLVFFAKRERVSRPSMVIDTRPP
jgi:mannose-6-phosphate isomerase-like protein (cupin superfamily)